MKDSGVFIDKSERRIAEKRATNPKTLARAIFTSLFTNDAIKKCTLSGASKSKDTSDKIGLPCQAVKALLGNIT